MKSPPFCAIINLLDYDTWKGAFFMGRKNPAKNINIGLLAHVDAGKTTLSEALLYATGQFFPSRRGFGCKCRMRVRMANRRLV